LDLSRLLCGSEGTLAFITEVKLSLDPIPACRILVNVKYDSFESALRSAPVMLKAEALSVETVDSRVLELARHDIIWHSVRDLITDVPGKEVLGLNMVEFAGGDPAKGPDRLYRFLHLVRDLLVRRRATELLGQRCVRPGELGEIGVLIERDSYGPGLFGQGLKHGLADPPYRVGDELHVPLRIESAGRFH